MPCRGVSLPEMGCPAMDLFCFFVEREKFFFHSANFSYQAIEIEIGFTFETTKLRGWISCMTAAFCFRENVPGTRDLEKFFFESSVEVLENNLAMRFPL